MTDRCVGSLGRRFTVLTTEARSAHAAKTRRRCHVDRSRSGAPRAAPPPRVEREGSRVAACGAARHFCWARRGRLPTTCGADCCVRDVVRMLKSEPLRVSASAGASVTISDVPGVINARALAIPGAHCRAPDADAVAKDIQDLVGQAHEDDDRPSGGDLGMPDVVAWYEFRRKRRDLAALGEAGGAGERRSEQRGEDDQPDQKCNQRCAPDIPLGHQPILLRTARDEALARWRLVQRRRNLVKRAGERSRPVRTTRAARAP
jgi:hypothetical protein